jgi:hypothetical protein
MSSCRSRLALLAMVVLTLSASAGQEHPSLACDRQMRKTFEAIQAWRRLNNGSYPGRLVDLETKGLLPGGGAICPDLLGEHAGSSARSSEKTSRGPQCDPKEYYEYEMSDCVSLFRTYLPADAPEYHRQQLKSVLLRRPFFEQVAILRCTRHPEASPARFAGDGPRRNLTVQGKIYWSGLYWEQLWLDDVPYCARDANVLFGLKGPPFHTNLAPTLRAALDLREWSCAFGDHAWWWTYPMFDEAGNRQWAAHLRPFFQEDHGRVLNLNGEDWWINGLVQLQGRTMRNNENMYTAQRMEAFVWNKTGARVARPVRRAAWLQGTVWAAKPGETSGWLVWHYIDGSEERVPIIYGGTTARFWGDQAQIGPEKDFPEPVWRHHEDKATVGKDRWLRIYRQEWANPRPDVTVASLDFVSNPECRAAPFLIAVNVFP